MNTLHYADTDPASWHIMDIAVSNIVCTFCLMGSEEHMQMTNQWLQSLGSSSNTDPFFMSKVDSACSYLVFPSGHIVGTSGKDVAISRIHAHIFVHSINRQIELKTGVKDAIHMPQFNGTNLVILGSFSHIPNISEIKEECGGEIKEHRTFPGTSIELFHKGVPICTATIFKSGTFTAAGFLTDKSTLGDGLRELNKFIAPFLTNKRADPPEAIAELVSRWGE